MKHSENTYWLMLYTTYNVFTTIYKNPHLYLKKYDKNKSHFHKHQDLFRYV